MAQMRSIATAGKGRFYQSNDPSQVPALLLDETQKGLKPWIVEQRFRPALDAPSPALSGLDLAGFPALDGYVASTPKAAAEVVLRSPAEDPVMAQWQYGLGRAVAWTSDVQGRWTRDLLAWRDSARLLGNIVESTLPLAADPQLALQTSTAGDTGRVIAALSGAPADATVSATVVAPDLQSTEVPLQSTGPGRFEADFPADQVGGYLVHVTVSSKGKLIHAATAGLPIAYSPEYRYLGTDLSALRELARVGGGEVLPDPRRAFDVPLPEVRVDQPLYFWLLALAVVLFPLDVALRRLVLRRSDAELWAAVVRRREAAPVAVEATLGRLRGRITTHRTGRRGPPPEAEPGAQESPAAERRREESKAGEASDLAARLVERRRRRGG